MRANGDYEVLEKEYQAEIMRTFPLMQGSQLLMRLLPRPTYIQTLRLLAYHQLITLNWLYNRTRTANESILGIVPQLAFSDDYSIQTINGHPHSTLIGLYNYLDGCYNTVFNAVLYPRQKIDICVNIPLYILSCRDFCMDVRGTLANSHIFDSPMTILFEKCRESDSGLTVMVGGVPYTSLPLARQRDVLIECVLMQQNVQHAGVHVLCTYAYLVLQNGGVLGTGTVNGVDSESDEPDGILSSIRDYGSSIRNVTEGMGIPTIFGQPNSSNMNEDEVRRVVSHLSDWHLKIYSNLLARELHTPIIRRVYRLYRMMVLSNITHGSIAAIARSISKPKKQTRNLLVNAMFLLTFYHNWTHFVLTFIPSHYSQASDGLINQLYNGCENSKLNTLLLRVQSEIRTFAPQYASLIGNAHVRI
jgi:hypothetical protein